MQAEKERLALGKSQQRADTQQAAGHRGEPAGVGARDDGSRCRPARLPAVRARARLPAHREGRGRSHRCILRDTRSQRCARSDGSCPSVLRETPRASSEAAWVCCVCVCRRGKVTKPRLLTYFCSPAPWHPPPRPTSQSRREPESRPLKMAARLNLALGLDVDAHRPGLRPLCGRGRVHVICEAPLRGRLVDSGRAGDSPQLP